MQDSSQDSFSSGPVGVPTSLEGGVSGAGQRHAVVVSKWNEFITFRLRDGAVAALQRHGVSAENITVVYVPGAFELGSTARELADTGRFDAVICIGCVIRGATDHYDYVAGQAARLVSQAAYDSGKPVIFGVLTTDTIEQAIERAGTKAGNKGYEAALTAIEMVDLYKKIRA
jgi:6,7-dimethyl-8-ribityllumazine synthase